MSSDKGTRPPAHSGSTLPKSGSEDDGFIPGWFKEEMERFQIVEAVEAPFDISQAARRICDLHGEVKAFTSMALDRAIQIGEQLEKVQAHYKHKRQYEHWITNSLEFGSRTARAYVQIYRHRFLVQSQSPQPLSMRAALKLIADTANAAVPPADSTPPAPAPPETDYNEQNEPITREILLIEADSDVVEKLLKAVRSVVTAGKEVHFERVPPARFGHPLSDPFAALITSVENKPHAKPSGLGLTVLAAVATATFVAVLAATLVGFRTHSSFQPAPPPPPVPSHQIPPHSHPMKPSLVHPAKLTSMIAHIEASEAVPQKPDLAYWQNQATRGRFSWALCQDGQRRDAKHPLIEL